MPKTTLAVNASALGQIRMTMRSRTMKADFQGLIAVLSAVAFSLCGWGLILLELGARLHYPVMI